MADWVIGAYVFKKLFSHFGEDTYLLSCQELMYGLTQNSCSPSEYEVTVGSWKTDSEQKSTFTIWISTKASSWAFFFPFFSKSSSICSFTQGSRGEWEHCRPHTGHQQSTNSELQTSQNCQLTWSACLWAAGGSWRTCREYIIWSGATPQPSCCNLTVLVTALL